MAEELSTIPEQARRGRGAATNRSGRFERFSHVPVADEWTEEALSTAPVLRTRVSVEMPKRVITRNQSPDVPFDRSLNPYRGCEHGCIYCFARPTHAYLGLSPGLDFETRLIARPDAPTILARELSARGYRPATIAIGTNTDPYQPVESQREIMRAVLEVLDDFNHPVAIATKGTLIERDIDILSRMAARGLAHVGVSITTLDADLSRRIEPRVPLPARRLEVIRRLSGAGIPVRVMVSPVIPALTDHEAEAILAAAAAAGAQAASWIMLRLPHEVSPLFRAWLEDHFPDRAGRVMARIREMHGGKDYEAQWGRRMRGQGHYAKIIAQRFEIALKRLGLDGALAPLRCDLFAPPLARGAQLSLF